MGVTATYVPTAQNSCPSKTISSKLSLKPKSSHPAAYVFAAFLPQIPNPVQIDGTSGGIFGEAGGEGIDESI